MTEEMELTDTDERCNGSESRPTRKIEDPVDAVLEITVQSQTDDITVSVWKYGKPQKTSQLDVRTARLSADL